MQKPEQISLNAVRVFAVVAQSGSFKLAAARLGVTSGAVSRQVLNLEAAMGVQLFNRSNNSIQLTDTGDTFLRHARSGLHLLNRSIETAMGDGRSITVQFPTTLATRWLVPLLKGFKKRWSDITVRIETNDGTGLEQNPRADVTVAYFPISEPVRNAEILLEDRCRPYLSPNLLSQIQDTTDLASIPALQSTSSNWDWKTWLQEAKTPNLALRFDGHYDLDDVALRAAIAGVGMVLAPEFIIRDDLDAGRLCALPETPEILLGHYTLQTSTSANEAANIFAKWLRKAL